MIDPVSFTIEEEIFVRQNWPGLFASGLMVTAFFDAQNEGHPCR